MLKDLCSLVGLEIKFKNMAELQHLVEINSGHYNGYICFEYDNSKGLTFYSNIQDSMHWHGDEPIKLTDIIEEKHYFIETC